MLALGVACAKKQPPVARPTPPPPATTADTRPPAPPTPVAEPTPVPPEPVAGGRDLASRDIDQINKNSPFQPVFFAFDSSDVDGSWPAGAEHERRNPEEVPDLGDHD